jgi:hypothetical protein
MGDITVDWNLARIQKLADSTAVRNAVGRPLLYPQPGGAALMTRLLTKVAATLRADRIDVKVLGPSGPGRVRPADPRFHHSFAIWSRYPCRQGDQDRTAWRVEEFLGLDRARPAEVTTPVQSTSVAGAKDPADVDLVILDDADLGFRVSPELWPGVLSLPKGTAALDTSPQPWILLKMACPVASGDLWRRLLSLHASRLVVVMTLKDLRLSDVKISRELSWERIAGDLAREVLRQPAVNGLVRCAHVVVSLGTGGAVLLSRREIPDERLDQPDCHVLFDPESIENSWAEQHPGGMIGYTTCLAAGIARELVAEPGEPNIGRGVRRGLAAARALHLQGYHPTRDRLVFPAGYIAKKLAEEPNEFASAEVAQPVRDSWSILEDQKPEGLELVAQDVARQGIKAVLKDIPRARFGKFETVDRGEIEGFRSIRALMREYDAQPASRPLSIAVFGPPGSGKSFGVKAVAKSALDADRIEELTFNLSQMRDPSELADALHQVRDAGLRGKLPFVLWDEFDADLSGSFGWLRHFLAPMQDGAFQQGQILHPIGKAIFVFAGGTSVCLTDFAGNSSPGFGLAKGPDFVSRLKGHVDIVGPDPRGGDPDTDPYYRLRRAILLRTVLKRDREGLFEGDGESARLNIDSGVLRAFLGVPSYHHGARSLETIVAMSTLHGERRYGRSALPAANQLGAHVNARDFLAIVERYVPEGELLERLAEAFHVEYCSGMLADGYAWSGTPEYLADHGLIQFAEHEPDKGRHPSLVDYEDLPEDVKLQNRGAASDLPAKLAVLGYVLCQNALPEASRDHVDLADPRFKLLAKREHERWLAYKIKTGWRYADERDNPRRLHPAVLPWDELPDEERRKNLRVVQRLPQIVADAGMALARCGEPQELRIGVVGHEVLAEPDRNEAGIEAALTWIEMNHPDRPLVVVCALAEGADRLVTKAILRRPGSQLKALLPLPKFDFLNDFASADSKEEFLRLLARADKVTELSGASHDAAYAAANDRLLEEADILLAVWDGEDDQGRTAKVVADARARGLPLAWVHAANGTPDTTAPNSGSGSQRRVTYERFR